MCGGESEGLSRVARFSGSPWEFEMLTSILVDNRTIKSKEYQELKIDELIRQQCPEGVETKRLGDIGTFRRGKGISKKDMKTEDTGIPAVHYSQIFTDFGPVARTPSIYIEDGVVDNPIIINTGDILINIASVSPLGIGRATAWLGDSGVVASGNMVTISNEQDPRYLSYFLNSHYYEDQKNRIAREGVITYLSVPELKKIEIPLPPISPTGNL